MTQDAALVIDDVVKRFGRGNEIVTAVDHMSFTVKQGEFVSVIGPSGCGKSTLLRMVAGLEEITSGTIRIGDRSADNVPLIRDYVPLASLDDLVFGGWDVFEDDAYVAASRAGVLEGHLPAAVFYNLLLSAHKPA